MAPQPPQQQQRGSSCSPTPGLSAPQCSQRRPFAAPAQHDPRPCAIPAQRQLQNRSRWAHRRGTGSGGGPSLHTPQASRAPSRVVPNSPTVPYASPNFSSSGGGAARQPKDDHELTALPVRVVGVGGRTTGALASLAQQQDFSAQVWYLDHDAKQLQASQLTNVALLRPDAPPGTSAEDLLSAEDLQNVVGPVFLPDGSLGAGITFLLASAGDSKPSGADAVAEVAAALRRAGHFTVAVVTCPFEFEGPRKGAAAGKLLDALQKVAHMTVTVEQEVLAKSSGPSGPSMTAAEAKAIADRALEHAVRCVATSVRVTELLVVSNGAAAWHSRARGNLRRRMTPPLQQLLTSPGTAVLGRGQAVAHSGLLQRLGVAETMQQLAADAVRAAAESPFLERCLGDEARAPAGLVCSITLPPDYLDALGGAGQLPSATRLAAQAGGGLLVDLLGGHCNVLVCAQPGPVHGHSPDSDEVRVEATLLVVRHPPGMQPPPPAGAQAGTRQRGTLGISGRVAQTRERVRLPPSAWSAMSALAGGTAAAPGRPAATPASAAAANGAVKQQPGQQQAQQPVRRQYNSPFTRPVAPPQQQPGGAGAGAAPQQEAPGTVGDFLVDSLTAQSLDLPPAAAKWRQHIRRQAAASLRSLVVTEETVDDDGTDEEPDGSWGEQQQAGPEGVLGGLLGALGGGAKRGRPAREMTVRERASSMLEKDRSGSYDSE